MAKFVCVIMALASFGVLSFADMNADISEMISKGKTISENCMKQEKITDDDIQKAYKSMKVEDKMGCFFHCLAKEFEIIDDNNMASEDWLNEFGETIEEELKKVGQEDMFKSYKEIVIDCLGKQDGGSDGCAVAQAYAQCIMDGAAKISKK